MKGNTIVLALLTGAITIVAMSSVAYASDWTTFQKDNIHSGITTDSAPTAIPGFNWTSSVGSGGMAGIDVAPIVADGKIFVVAYNGSVFAFNKTTGSQVWCNTQLGSDGFFELGTPVYNNGVLYIVLSRGNASTTTGVHALWANNGTVKWTTPNIGNEQTNTPVLYDSGRIYFGTVNMTGYYASDKGTYYCYNADNGNPVWRRNTTSGGGYYWAGAAIYGSFLVYGDDKSMLVSVNKVTGNLSYSMNVSEAFGVQAKEIRSSVRLNLTTGKLYFTSQGGYCFAVGYAFQSGQFSNVSGWAAPVGFSTSTPTVYGDRVFVGLGAVLEGNGETGCKILNATTGSLIANVSANGPVQASPVVAVNTSAGTYHVYFTTNTYNGTVYCIDSDGNTVWTYLPPAGKREYVLQGVAVSDGYVYFGNDAGYLFGLRA